MLLPHCLAHMKLSYPIPLGDPSLGGSDPDYDEISPLDPSGQDYPCKGYANAAWNQQATWTAGQTYNMTVAGSAVHGGGSCQLSLSYDKQTFRVIKSIIGGCPLARTYDFGIPLDAPSGQVIFAWTWQNEIGNREFYMNCAQVGITGLTSRSIRRSEALTDLPQIWIANIPGINSCTTTAGIDPVYPAPGCSVEYGGEYNGTSRPAPTSSSGECDFGSSQPTCTNLESVPGVFAEGAGASDSASGERIVQTASISSGSTTGGVQNPGMNMAEMPASSTSRPLLNLSTVTDFALTSSTAAATVQVLPQIIAPLNGGPLAEEQSPDGGPMLLVPLNGGPLVEEGPSGTNAAQSPACPGDVTMTATAPALTITMSPPSTTTQASIQTQSIRPTSRPYPPPSSRPTLGPPQSSQSLPQPSTCPDYAGNNVMAYMPCVPGSLLCSNANTFYTCDQTTRPDQRWAWQYPRQVAAGMMCQPDLVACSAGSEGCSTGSAGRCVPSGYARVDQYIRA